MCNYHVMKVLLFMCLVKKQIKKIVVEITNENLSIMLWFNLNSSPGIIVINR